METAGPVILGIIACLLLAIGSRKTHKVYDDDQAEFGILTFSRISDRALVADTTFTGVIRKGERLYTTYDRSSPHGKRSCPT